MQSQRNSLCNCFRTWLVQVAVWIGLCGWALGSSLLARAQELDSIPPPRIFTWG